MAFWVLHIIFKNKVLIIFESCLNGNNGLILSFFFVLFFEILLISVFFDCIFFFISVIMSMGLQLGYVFSLLSFRCISLFWPLCCSLKIKFKKSMIIRILNVWMFEITSKSKLDPPSWRFVQMLKRLNYKKKINK